MDEYKDINPIFTRRSIRRFLDKPVEDEKLERLMRAAMQSPSGKNAQPWEFLIVRDAEKRLQISKMSAFAGMCRYAPVVIVTMANMDRVSDNGTWWMQDMAACTQNILLQAVNEGLGAVWCGFYPIESRVDRMTEFFKLPENVIPFSVVALGYSERENKFTDRYIPERVHFENWN